jgi:hypothetical protein
MIVVAIIESLDRAACNLSLSILQIKHGHDRDLMIPSEEDMASFRIFFRR